MNEAGFKANESERLSDQWHYPFPHEMFQIQADMRSVIQWIGESRCEYRQARVCKILNDSDPNPHMHW